MKMAQIAPYGNDVLLFGAVGLRRRERPLYRLRSLSSRGGRRMTTPSPCRDCAVDTTPHDAQGRPVAGAWQSVASRCSAHKTVGARADAAAIDVSRKKWRRDGAELITFFIVQPCDGARRRASGWDMMANKIWANFHGVYLVGMSMRSSSRRQSCIRSAMRLTIFGESMLVFELRMSGSALRKGTTPCRTMMPRSIRKPRI